MVESKNWQWSVRKVRSYPRWTDGVYFPDGGYFALGFWDQPSLLSESRHSILKSLVAQRKRHRPADGHPLADSEAAQYLLMASAKEGGLEVADASGKKGCFKPGGAPKLGKLEAFGYLATVQGQGLQQGDSASHSLVLQLRLTGSKEDWNVAEALVLQVDGRQPIGPVSAH